MNAPPHGLGVIALTARRAIVIVLCVLFIAPLGFVHGADRDQADGASAYPLTVERVWYRTQASPGIRGAKHSGDLTITEEALEFSTRKLDLFVPWSAVRMISLSAMRGDVDTEWVVLAVDRGRGRERIGLRDGRLLGYGGRTRELYDTLIAAARHLSAAQFDAPPGFEPFVELQFHYVMAVPRGWSSYYHEVVDTDGRPLGGTLVLSPNRLLAPEGASREAQQGERARARERIVAGAETAWILVRQPSRDVDGCSGLGSDAAVRLSESVAGDPFFGAGLPAPREADWQVVEFAGCRGMRLGIADRSAAAADAKILELHVVSDGETLFMLGLRTTVEVADDALRLFRQGTESAHVSAAD